MAQGPSFAGSEVADDMSQRRAAVLSLLGTGMNGQAVISAVHSVWSTHRKLSNALEISVTRALGSE